MNRWRAGDARSLRADAIAGLTLGIESVPDGLAGGLLAAVNPLYGLYAYIVGTFAGALSTSSAFMAVQATGAMAIVIADVDTVHNGLDPGRALFTLAVMTGSLMIVAGLLGLGTLLRFVSNAVMVGFISAVGVNIVLGQLSGFTGYAADGATRVARAIETFLHPGLWEPTTVVIGAATIGLIILLERTPIGALGLVLAVALTSVAAEAIAAFGIGTVPNVSSIAPLSGALPSFAVPDVGLVPTLLVPAIALAFVGLMQGAAISASVPNPDGEYPDASRDFVGEGVANVAAGLFSGMPVGGSMSATSLVTTAGARSRLALVIASAVMTLMIVVFPGLVGRIALPALAGLLIVVGLRTIRPSRMSEVARTGPVQAVVLTVTFVLTMLIALQYAVLVGIGISMILFVIRQSNTVRVKSWDVSKPGVVIESDPPRLVPQHGIVVLQLYGATFFAAAPVFEQALPEVTEESGGSVVIVRLRGYDDLGSTFAQVLRRYAESLSAVGSKLVIVSTSPQVRKQLDVTGTTDVIGDGNIYEGDERVGAALSQAFDDARLWVDLQPGASAVTS